MENKVKTFFIMTLGTIIISAGIYFFKFPNNFSTGGVSGISVILSAVFKAVSAGGFVLAINILLLIVGFLFMGKAFGVKTVYCSMVMSIILNVLERTVPLSEPLTGQPMLELIFAIALPALGSALLFNIDASTGGTDIVAMIIKKYFKTNISKALFVSDFLVVMITAFVFGVETWLYSMLGFFAKVFVVNNLLENINMSKYCTVITEPEFEEKISNYITEVLHKSATVSHSYKSAYMNETKSVLLVALTPNQAKLLKSYVKKLDEKAFIIVSSTSEISGKGFKETV